MEEILDIYKQKFEDSYKDEDIDWLKDKLTAFEKTIKQEFLKRILPEAKETYQTNHSIIYDERNCGYNDCRNDLITNSLKEGVNIK